MSARRKGVESDGCEVTTHGDLLNQADGIVSKELRDLLARVDWARTVGARLCFEAREMTAVAAKMRATAARMRRELSSGVSSCVKESASQPGCPR